MPKKSSPPLPTLTNCLRQLRFEHQEMTQEQLATKVGVTRQTIIAIEAGNYSPSLMLAFRLARVFGRGIEDVFKYSSGKNGQTT